jgi:acyl-CoA synthetase (AMP-forming)/AMP-acid ligase II
MLLSEIPEIAAHHEPDKIAMWFEGKSWTYTQLRDRCWKLSHALATIAKQGDRIAILSENCTEYAECYYGVPGAGMCLTFLNYRLTARELAYIINNNTPSAIIVQQKYLPTIRQILPELTSVKTVIVIGDAADGTISYEALLARGEATKPAVKIEEDDLCWLLYTSGTTGLPKGAMLTHKNLIASITNSMANGAEALPDEVPLFMFPLFHVAGYALPLYHLRTWTVVILQAFDVMSFLEAVQKYKITSGPMAPTMLAMLLENPKLKDYDLSSLRGFGYGASSMPLEVLRKGFAAFPGRGFATGFGMTELAGNVMALSKQDHVRAAEEGLPIISSVGKQMPLSRVRVLRDDNTDAAPNEPGEIVIKGDQVLKGYWNNPKATEEAFIDGWFRSGDVGRWDDEGYLYIVDRKKDMVLTGGENVYPREVEEVLYQHPAILEAAVLGTPDPKWGESVVAALVLREGHTVTAAEIGAFCKERIASYKKPKFVCYVPALPRNASGKVLKRELRERIAAGDLPLDAG